MVEEHRCSRRVVQCWLVEEDWLYTGSPVRICTSKRLAEHYCRLLSPKFEELFGFGLRVRETTLYVDNEEDLVVGRISCDDERRVV